MEQLSKIALSAHIIAGFSSILLFWIPTLTKKGSKIHRQVGKAYIFLMWIVVATAVILCIKNVYFGAINRAIFLGFLALITSRPIWFGIAILYHKKALTPRLKNIHLALKVIIAIYGISMLIYGISLKGEGFGMIMIIFGIFGITSAQEVWKDLKSTSTESNWIIEHLDGMFTSAIAAYTAFLVFGSYNYIGKYLDGYTSMIPWILPTFVGMYLISRAKKKYAVKH